MSSNSGRPGHCEYCGHPKAVHARHDQDTQCRRCPDYFEICQAPSHDSSLGWKICKRCTCGRAYYPSRANVARDLDPSDYAPTHPDYVPDHTADASSLFYEQLPSIRSGDPFASRSTRREIPPEDVADNTYSTDAYSSVDRNARVSYPSHQRTLSDDPITAGSSNLQLPTRIVDSAGNFGMAFDNLSVDDLAAASSEQTHSTHSTVGHDLSDSFLLEYGFQQLRIGTTAANYYEQNSDDDSDSDGDDDDSDDSDFEYDDDNYSSVTAPGPSLSTYTNRDSYEPGPSKFPHKHEGHENESKGKGKESKGKESKCKERKSKESKGKEKKGKDKDSKGKSKDIKGKGKGKGKESKGKDSKRSR
ncbi:uncharacterized protein B0I36DRAFT_401065 [Microdochium trichocladiopsis]|uniref:Stc1 domain-containing protein n=1 Tax=Microdochium trichocladiopsis TaxID=1682393 RepID=A0A9P8XQC2_9PEZI|nr:uncharacterized protein B0I36DRAFT_401065 [Microdochium trichocladiopsis]KAH7010912.1 hypothetical protein B0I36DRAFT_401065 [Microdochium trichocladiopsis]